MPTITAVAPRRARILRDRWLTPPRSRPPRRSSHSVFLLRLDLIDDLIRAVASRSGLQGADAEEFRSWTYEKLLKDDCKALREFRGRSSLKTYLYAIVGNLLRDFRDAQYGARWRPAAGVARLGRWATALDRLVNRDNVPGGEAVRIVSRREDCEATETELWRLLQRVPPRRRPRAVALEAAFGVAATCATDSRLLATEQAAARRSIREKLEEALASLAEEDRQVVRLRFWDGLTVADVSRALGVPQKPLYRRLDRCLGQLRVMLEDRGVSAGDLACFGGLDADA